MDHIPLPQNPFTGYPVVKCLCAANCTTDGPFRIRPLSSFGFTKEQFATGSNNVPSLHMAAPFLQAWLWYGLLERVFTSVGVTFDPAEFVAEDDSAGFRLSTVALHRYLWYWLAAASQTSKAKNIQHAKQISEYFGEASDALLKYTVGNPGLNAPQIQDNSTFGPFLDDDASSDVLLAVSVIAEALGHAHAWIYPGSQESHGHAWFESLSTRLSLLKAGWCIKELSQLTEQFQSISKVTTLLYLGRINRHTLAKDHCSCKLESCTYEKIDYATYRPMHTSAGCCCADVTLTYKSQKRIDLLLCKGYIPLITFAPNDSFGPRLDAHAFIEGITKSFYVAISHVWSDRLGNLRENALPACQLQWLQTQVNHLYPNRHNNVPFWIDTICVPQEMTTRRLAIGNMGKVYSKADKVLVLDSSLRAIHSLVSSEELLNRIILAPWSRRLWTYHEGALAKRIYFQLNDRAVIGDEILKRYHCESSGAAGCVRMQDLLQIGAHEESNRALVRAMALKENGQGFLDLQSEPAKRVGVITSAASTQDLDTSAKQEDLVSIPKEKKAGESGENWYRGENLDLIEAEAAFRAQFATIQARFATIQATHTENTSLDAEVAPLLELVAQMKTKADELEINLERLRVNMLGGLPDRQVPTAGLSLQIPTTWLERAPQDCDRSLAVGIDRITGSGVPSIYRLRGFDPIRMIGMIAYMELRTSFKRVFLNMFTDSVPKCEQVREAILALCWRATSWSSDEAVCLAIILGMDVGKVQEVRNEDRMKILASMWQEVPDELAFCRLKRIQGDGFGWMPQSFLGSGVGITGRRWSGTGKGYRSKRGLCVEARGIMFRLPSEKLEGHTLAFRMDEKWFEVFLDSKPEPQSWDDGHSAPLAVVFKNDIGEGLSQRYTQGVVARVVEESAKMIYIVHVFCVGVNLVDNLDGLVLLHQPTITSRDQEWCIG